MTVAPLPPDHNPVFVLGHQKAGTSVIAAVLGEYSGLQATIDLKQEIRDLLIPGIVTGDAKLDELIKRNRDEFAVPIVKHPNLTLIYPALRQRFPASRFVFVVRDPRDNIRSILDRLTLPGDSPEISADRWHEIPKPWRLILGEGQPDRSRHTYLEAVADRWAAMVRVYVDNDADMSLIRYEDFRAAKVPTITALAAALGLPAATDISTSVNHQYQGKGANRDVPFVEFFGAENLSRIERQCRPEMLAMGYVPYGDDDA